MTNNQKSKKTFALLEDRAKGGMGWLRLPSGMKGKPVSSGGYRQLAAAEKPFRVEGMGVESGGRFSVSITVDPMRWLKEGRWTGIWKCLAGSDKGVLEKMVGGGFLLDEGRGLGQVVCCQGPWNVDLQIPPGQECSNGSLLCIRRGHPGLIYFDCGVRNVGESFIPHFA